MYNNFKYKNDRFGFAAPFLLGGLTGAVGMAAFGNGRRPVMYYPYQYPYTNYYPYYY